MNVHNVLAGVAVRNLEAATAWYERLLGAEGSKPMGEVSEWKAPGGGCLQVFADPKRAGSSSVTFAIGSLKALREHLRSIQVEPTRTQEGGSVSLAFVQDPDGNQIVFAEAHGGKLAR